MESLFDTIIFANVVLAQSNDFIDAPLIIFLFCFLGNMPQNRFHPPIFNNPLGFLLPFRGSGLSTCFKPRAKNSSFLVLLERKEEKCLILSNKPIAHFLNQMNISLLYRIFHKTQNVFDQDILKQQKNHQNGGFLWRPRQDSNLRPTA